MYSNIFTQNASCVVPFAAVRVLFSSEENSVSTAGVSLSSTLLCLSLPASPSGLWLFVKLKSHVRCFSFGSCVFDSRLYWSTSREKKRENGRAVGKEGKRSWNMGKGLKKLVEGTALTNIWILRGRKRKKGKLFSSSSRIDKAEREPSSILVFLVEDKEQDIERSNLVFVQLLKLDGINLYPTNFFILYFFFCITDYRII